MSKIKKKLDKSKTITRSEVVCKSCGTREDVKPRRVYCVSDDFAKGYYTLTQPYCSMCYQNLGEYEG